MRIRSRLFAIVPAAVAAVVLMGGPALAAGDTMTMSRYGHLLARGAAVTLQVTVTCSPVTDQWGNVYDTVETDLTISQAVRGGHITQASGKFYPVACNDQPQVLKAYLIPSTWAFQKGKAVAWASSVNMSAQSMGFSVGPKVVTIR